jgi:endonuclease/exonuclease/phosphatase (EEP) superfamily protein YafD
VWLRCVLIGGGGILSALTLAGFASGAGWAFERASHFRAQYFLCLIVVALVLALMRRWIGAIGFAVFALINAAALLPLYTGGGPTATRTPRTLRAMAMNVRTSNRRVQKVRDTIRNCDPDFILIQEVSDRWMFGLAGLDKTYPHVIAQPRDDNFGIALYSKLPFRNARILYIGGAKVPSVLAELKTPDGLLTVLGTHLPPPPTRSRAHRRNRQLAAMPGVLPKAGPVVLLGDLNITPFSAYFGRLLEASRLRDSSRGHGYQPTWPVHRPMFLIPIDHFFHSPDIRIVARQIGPDVGSDHYPLIVDFNLPAHEPK